MIFSEKECEGMWDRFCYGLSYLSRPRVPGGDPEMVFHWLETGFERCHVSRWHFRHVFQLAGSLKDMEEVPRRYVEKCLGHRVPDSFWRDHPLLCVLIAREFVGGRWRKMEDVIMSDSESAYFYAKLVVGGRLPFDLHGRLGLSSFSGLDYGLRRYFSEFAQV